MARRKSTELAAPAWEKALAEYAKDTSESLAGTGGGSFISLNGGQFNFNDAVLPSPLPVVIVATIRENLYYEGDYDPDHVASPVCFSLADPALPPTEREAAMAPHSTVPQPQAENCAGCPQNKFGSAERGHGKACKNTVRLAMLSAEALDPDGITTTEIVQLRTPVTSVKIFRGYVDRLANVLGRPPFGVITNIDIVRDDRTQFKLGFSVSEKLTAKVGNGVLTRMAEANEMLIQPPQPRTDDDTPVPVTPAKKRGRKTTTKRQRF